MFSHALPVVLVLFTAAITPGPNNFLVLARAANGGLAAALPAIAGIVAGSLFLLSVAWTGASALLLAEPRVRLLLGAAGAVYLVRLGWSLVRPAEEDAAYAGALPSTAAGAALFQLANPKAWMLVAAVAAASLAAAQPLPLTLAAALVAALSATCLLVWAMAGATLARSLADRSRRRFLNRGMGLMLIASAPLLLI